MICLYALLKVRRPRRVGIELLVRPFLTYKKDTRILLLFVLISFL
jgi:hypothetical protein